MTQEIAYFNGQYIPADQLMVPPQDMGFMLGVTVAEQLRTFGGFLFELESHLVRLGNSLAMIGLSGISVQRIADAAEHVTAQNFSRLEDGMDMGVTIFVTPGLYPMYSDGSELEPNIGIHTYPLPFALWADKYKTGQHCEIVSVQQVNETCWPRALKCRSRMHYYLADREARTRNPAARAILLDALENVNEASTANVVAYFADEGLVSPPRASILPGISLSFVERLAADIHCPFEYRPIAADELNRADEILLTSTPFCILPISRLGARSIEQRDCFRRLLNAWSNQVGFDIEAQAKRS